MKIEKLATTMDGLGLIAFLYVIIYSIISLNKDPNTLTIILLIIGIGGFLFDSFVVINTCGKKKK